LVCLTLSFNVLTNLFYTDSSTRTFQNIFRIKLLLFNFSLRLQRFQPFFPVLGFFHHIKELLTAFLQWKFSNMIFNISKLLNKSWRLCFFNFEIVLLNVRKFRTNLIFIKEYFDSRISEHATLLTLFFYVVMWDVDTKISFNINDSMCGNHSYTIVNFQFLFFIEESDSIGPIIHLFIRI
jgi:hypothetical protein